MNWLRSHDGHLLPEIVYEGEADVASQEPSSAMVEVLTEKQVGHEEDTIHSGDLVPPETMLTSYEGISNRHIKLGMTETPILIGEIDLELESEEHEPVFTSTSAAEQLDSMLANVMVEDYETYANDMLVEENALLRAFGAALLVTLDELQYSHIKDIVEEDPQAAFFLADWLSGQAQFKYKSLVWKAFDESVHKQDFSTWLLTNVSGESGSHVLLDYMISRDERGVNSELYRKLAESETSPTTIRRKSAAALTLHESPRELHQFFTELTENLLEDDPFRAHAERLALEYEGPESAYRAEPYLTLDRVDGFMARNYEGNWEDLAIRVEQVATVSDAFVEPGVVPRLYTYINDFGDYPPDADGRAIDRILTRIGNLIELGGDLEVSDESEEDIVIQ